MKRYLPAAFVVGGVLSGQWAAAQRELPAFRDSFGHIHYSPSSLRGAGLFVAN